MSVTEQIEELQYKIHETDKRLHNANSVRLKRDLNKYRKRLKQKLKKLQEV